MMMTLVQTVLMMGSVEWCTDIIEIIKNNLTIIFP